MNEFSAKYPQNEFSPFKNLPPISITSKPSFWITTLKMSSECVMTVRLLKQDTSTFASSRPVLPSSMVTTSFSFIKRHVAFDKDFFLSRFNSRRSERGEFITAPPILTAPPCTRTSLCSRSSVSRSRLTVSTETLRSLLI